MVTQRALLAALVLALGLSAGCSSDDPPPAEPENAGGAMANDPFADDDWLIVEVPEDPESEDDLLVLYSDDVESDYQDLVQRSVEVVKTFPGVTETHQEDTELVVVNGTTDAKGIDALLRRWWKEQVKEH